MSLVKCRFYGQEMALETIPKSHTRVAFSTTTWDFVTWTDGVTDAGYQKHVESELRAMALRVRREVAS